MEGKERKYSKKYSPEFKISVILDMLESQTSYNKINKKYGITGHHTVKGWIDIYLSEGAVGFYENRYEKAIDMEKRKRGRPKKVIGKQQKDLLAELKELKEQNELLRMENDFLKKLDALIQAEKQKK